MAWEKGAVGIRSDSPDPPVLCGGPNSSPGSLQLPGHQDVFGIMTGDVCSLTLTPVPYSGRSVIVLATRLLSLPYFQEDS